MLTSIPLVKASGMLSS